MIPKKIHYCWFGRGPKDKLFEKCYRSWRKFFPGWEIIEWNEDNFDVNFCEYTKRAYELKKYAFVSDVARLKVIYDEGGIYFDTDVEVIRKFDQEFLKEGYFGEEESGSINTGIGFAAPKHNEAVRVMLDSYDNLQKLEPTISKMLHKHGLDEYRNLLKEEMNGNGPVFPCPMLNTAALIQAGYNIKVGDKIAGIPIYAPDFFCGFDFRNNCLATTSNTFSIHHFSSSWKDKHTRNREKMRRRMIRTIGRNNYEKLKNLKNGIIKGKP